MAWRIGLDIGVTFTDIALVDEASGHITVVKLLTWNNCDVEFERAFEKIRRLGGEIVQNLRHESCTARRN
jgi:N-methylhydantoinase A/oxoprolinase/acetone carboxylase beta subunit